MGELSPEDTDEPERLELLDAAIPTRSAAPVTPVRPRCAHGVSSPPLPPCHTRPEHTHTHTRCLTTSRDSSRHYLLMSRQSAESIRQPSVCLRRSDPCRALGGEELTPPHAREGAAAGESQMFRQTGARRENVKRFPESTPQQRGSTAPGLILAGKQLWIPCATLRIVINTPHCSEDAPS